MLHVTLARAAGLVACCLALSTAPLVAQELPLSGVSGFDYFYATSPGGTSQLYATNVHRAELPFPIGAAVEAVPSRWAHRRRTLGALETAIASPERGLFVTPMGTAAGQGALHVVDLRGTLATALIPTQHPAGYDVAFVRDFKFVFSAEDDGAGNTTLRGWSYAAVGGLVPLTPPALTLPGSPAAYVNRMGVDGPAAELCVPTATGVHVIALSASAPHVALAQSLATAPAAPTTNALRFERGGQTTWAVGTSTFDSGNPLLPIAAGYLVWDASGASFTDTFGAVPGQPGKHWVPAAGTEELAVVDDGTDAYVYYLLREPPPGTFFIKPSAIGVVRLLGADAPVTSTILMPDDVGEPFANPAVHGARVAFESSFGPPFLGDPPGGGEKISILYSPLDALGAGSPDGVLGVPDPLGGRISTKGMDRPIWSRDGTRVFAATSHFPGAPNPGIPGLEVLVVPADVLVDEFVGPHTSVPNLPFPNQSIVFPSAFHPRQPGMAAALAGLSVFGNVFHQGLASIAAPEWGEVGQLQLDDVGFTQSPAIPNFRAILPASFNDATGSVTPVPATFGARRTTFNLAASFGLDGLVMSAAIDDEILVQSTGVNVQAALGLTPAVDTIRVPLPAGWITTTEFLSL